MNEVLLAAFIGAVFGGFVTQITMFLLTSRKEKQDRKRLAIENLAAVFARGEGKIEPAMTDAIEHVEGLSDDELVAITGIAKEIFRGKYG